MALKDGLISYWKCGELSGTRSDSHGTNNLTDNGSVGTASVFGYTVADFNGSSQYLSITDGAQSGLDLSSTDKFSISAIVNSDDNSVYGYLLSKYLTTGNQRQWNIQQDGANGQIEINVSQNGSTSPFRIWLTDTGAGGFTFSNNTDYHIVVTVDATTDTATVYVNAATVTTTKSISAVSAINDGTGDVVMGGRDGGLSLFNGSIGHVAVWDRVISASDVSEIYDSGNIKTYDDWDSGGGETFTPKTVMF